MVHYLLTVHVITSGYQQYLGHVAKWENHTRLQFSRNGFGPASPLTTHVSSGRALKLLEPEHLRF